MEHEGVGVRWPEVLPFAEAVATRMRCRRIAVAGLGEPGESSAFSDLEAIAGGDAPGSLANAAADALDPGWFLLVGPAIPPSATDALLAAAAQAGTSGIVVARGGDARAHAHLSEDQQWLTGLGLAPLVSGWTSSESGGPRRDTRLHLIAPDLARGADSVPDGFDVLAVVPMYNEADVIERTIDHLLGQGVRVHVLDNWSDDGAFEVVHALAVGDPRLTVERFPADPNERYRWSNILGRLDEVGARSSAQWVLHVDADEQFEPYRPGLGLREALHQVDRAGYDAVDFTVIDFRPTAESVADGGLPQFWEFGLRNGHRNIQRAWRNRGSSVGIARTGGHVVPDPKRLFPLNFVLRHYSLRSPEHARRKIYRDRMPRYRASADRTKRGWHRQYDGYREEDPFLWDSASLHPWNEEVRLAWMPELTTRAGLEFGVGTYESSPFARADGEGLAQPAP